ncbi:YcaO-like family protein [Sphingomonas echinoides]|uniref:YcaO-like family protein n=1 Tax=Sphingomonas echinoides TaxID=59803 RepID=UPI00241387A0|nr:YcaO-like family protein [Sphingomonas echinoides]
MRTGLPADLGPAAHAYLDAFPKGDVVAFPIHPLDRLGLPVWVVALFPEDPALGGIMPYGVGYGATDEAAVLGGLGEIAEMVWPTLTLGARAKTRGSYAELVRSLGARAVADPLTLCLPAGSPVDHATVLEWVEARRWADGSSVLVPIDLAAYSSKELTPGYRPFTTIISNGMGAGPDLDWAIGHGLCEILQRDGNGLLFRALDRGVMLDLDTSLAPSTRAILDRFDAAGIRAMPKFATDQFGMPNLYCVGVDERMPPAAPIMVTACGEACHSDRTAALDKCLTEFAASRARKAFAHGPADLVAQVAPAGYVARFMAQAGGAAKSSDSRAFDAMRDWTGRDAATLRGWLAESVLSERGSHRFDALPTLPAPDGHARAAAARAAVEAAGFDVLYVDMSPADRAISVVKVIVPGMEVETMSYYRIGARNTEKLLALESPLIRFGADESQTLRRIRLTPADAERLGHPLFDTAAADALVGPLYPLYREPEAHHVAFARERGTA